jgi:hypothetical protein
MNIDEDFSEANDLAARNPQKLADLKIADLLAATFDHTVP